jgi:formylglycine-generating enzyme required for sulfatase activity
VGLSDPRLNLIETPAGPLLRRTGTTSTCKSVWGQDAIFDMVGNLDEWVDDPGGVFVGGFFSRSTRNGCEARVASHPPAYFDYSTGFRCCADLLGAAAAGVQDGRP